MKRQSEFHYRSKRRQKKLKRQSYIRTKQLDIEVIGVPHQMRPDVRHYCLRRTAKRTACSSKSERERKTPQLGQECPFSAPHPLHLNEIHEAENRPHGEGEKTRQDLRGRPQGTEVIVKRATGMGRRP